MLIGQKAGYFSPNFACEESKITHSRRIPGCLAAVYAIGKLFFYDNRPNRLNRCCTQLKSHGVKVLCVLHLH